MAINAYVSGFDSPCQSGCITDLEAEKVIDIKEWLVGTKTCVNHATSKWWWNVALSESYCNECYLSEEDITFLEENKRDFFQQLVREKIFEENNIFDLDHIVFKLFTYFKSLLQDKQIEVVLFSDIPHGPYNYILYITAQHLKINTFFMFSSFWEDLSFICKSVSEIGTFELSSGSLFPIEKKFEKYLPYMNVESRFSKLQRKIKATCNINNMIEKMRYRHRRYRMYHAFIEYYSILSLCRNLKRFRNSLLYTKYLKSKSISNFDMSCKFVYFALHLQPEMTTDTLGGRFYDQCLAIKLLRQILPEDWVIAVKENPKQTWYMRSPEFFKRLETIPNVVLLDKSINTYDLIKNSQFVATISGTVGWEAITGGKHALVFGVAWYRQFPGVTTYSKDITLRDILEKRIDHGLICRCAQNLRNTGYLFTANVDVINRIEHLNIDENLHSMKEAWRDKLLQLTTKNCSIPRAL